MGEAETTHTETDSTETATEAETVEDDSGRDWWAIGVFATVGLLTFMMNLGAGAGYAIGAGFGNGAVALLLFALGRALVRRLRGGNP